MTHVSLQKLTKVYPGADTPALTALAAGSVGAAKRILSLDGLAIYS